MSIYEDILGGYFAAFRVSRGSYAFEIENKNVTFLVSTLHNVKKSDSIENDQCVQEVCKIAWDALESCVNQIVENTKNFTVNLVFDNGKEICVVKGDVLSEPIFLLEI